MLEKLYFNKFVKEPKRKEIEELFLEVWERINNNEAGKDIVVKIYGGLEFVIYKGIVDHWGRGYGGSTGRSSLQSFVLYYPECPPGDKIGKEGKLFALAHEFAHVWLEHSMNNISNVSDEEKNKREEKACKKAIEWGFVEEKCK